MKYSVPYRPWQGIQYIIEVNKWCRDNIGPPAPMGHKLPYDFDKGGLWYRTAGYIHFKEEKDAMFFSLRWA